MQSRDEEIAEILKKRSALDGLFRTFISVPMQETEDQRKKRMKAGKPLQYVEYVAVRTK